MPEPDETGGEHVYSTYYRYLGQHLVHEKRCLLDDEEAVQVYYSYVNGEQLYGHSAMRAGAARAGRRMYEVGLDGEREMETLDPTWVGPQWPPSMLLRSTGRGWLGFAVTFNDVQNQGDPSATPG